MFKILTGICALVFAASTAGASVTLTFDSWKPIDEQSETFAEKGFTYQDSLSYFEPGRLYLHDDGGLTTSTIKRADGRAFNVHKVDIGAGSQVYRATEGPHPDGDVEFEFYQGTDSGPLMHLARVPFTYMIEGFLGFDRVASYKGISGGLRTFDFGDVFRGIDRLVVSVDLPNRKPGAIYTYWPLWTYGQTERSAAPYELGELVCDEWCTNLSLDNLTVSTVPLPAGFGLLATGIGLLLVGRRVQRRSSDV